MHILALKTYWKSTRETFDSRIFRIVQSKAVNIKLDCFLLCFHFEDESRKAVKIFLKA